MASSRSAWKRKVPPQLRPPKATSPHSLSPQGTAARSRVSSRVMPRAKSAMSGTARAGRAASPRRQTSPRPQRRTTALFMRYSCTDDKPRFARFAPPAAAEPPGGKARKTLVLRRGEAATNSQFSGLPSMSAQPREIPLRSGLRLSDRALSPRPRHWRPWPGLSSRRGTPCVRYPLLFQYTAGRFPHSPCGC